MRILLVEDDENKRQRIRAVLSAVPNTSVSESRSLRGAEDALDAERFDLVILDMSIPTFDIGPGEDGGSFQALGGHELLRYIKRYKVESPVAVVTQFNAFGRGRDSLTLSELDRKLRVEHGPSYLGAVYYDTASEAWKGQLLDVIKRVTEQGYQ